ncbi:MAG: hypothetical protein V3U79_05395 [Dehalococcoidia bacterium]
MKRAFLLAVLALGLGVLALSPAPASADSHDLIEGQVTNGTPGAPAPADLEVVLIVFEDAVAVDQFITTTDAEGGFRFSNVPLGPGLIYVVSVEHQGAFYQAEASPGQGAPIGLEVYESTSLDESIVVLDDTMMLTRGDDEFAELLIRQVVRVRNDGQHTFVPSFGEDGQGVMSFLRFSLPIGYQDLTVRSDLLGGQIIPIDRGVGITAPVPPGIHALVLAYTVPYEGTNLVFEPLYPFGAELVRVLLREDVGRLIGSDLEEKAPISVSGNDFKVYEISGIAAEDRVTLGFADLPQAPWTQRVWNAINNEWELTMVIPGFTGILLLALIAYAWRLRHRRPQAVDPSTLTKNIQRQPAQLRLVEAIARLDEEMSQGDVSEEEYEARRLDLKQALMRLALGDARSV